MEKLKKCRGLLRGGSFKGGHYKFVFDCGCVLAVQRNLRRSNFWHTVQANEWHFYGNAPSDAHVDGVITHYESLGLEVDPIRTLPIDPAIGGSKAAEPIGGFAT